MKKITILLIMLFITTISYSQDILINENFNGPTLPTDWRAFASSDSGNGTQIWTFGNEVVSGVEINFPTNAAVFDDNTAGNTGNHDKVWLWYRTAGAVGVDVTAYNDVILEYDYALNVIIDETLTVGLWNGSDAFIPIRIYTTDTNPTHAFIDINDTLAIHPEVDASALFIGFGYDDVNSNWAWGAGIDNVKLTGYNPPANDECINAEIINDDGIITATTFGSTNTGALTLCELVGGGGSCTNGGDGETDFGLGIWYVYTSTTSETITISTANVGTNFDTELQVWSGSCGALTCIGSDDDSGNGFSGELDSTLCWQSTGSASNPVNYYIYVNGDAPMDRGNFVLTLNTDQSTASNEAFKQSDFSIYLNPIKNIRSIASQEIITKVTNLLGQEVKTINPYTNNVSVDINNLETGVYIIKLNANDKKSTKKFIKEG